MRPSTLLRIFFIIYCVEAGVLLIFVPWSTVWDRILLQFPFFALRNFFSYPVVRGAVTGFGLVHLVWGAHDLHALITGRSPDAPPPV